MNPAVHHDLKHAFNCWFRDAVAGISLGMGDEEVGSVKHAGRAYIDTPATPAGVDHRDRGPAVSHGWQYVAVYHMWRTKDECATIVRHSAQPVPERLPRSCRFEATSALDYERIIQQNMQHIVQGRTVLIIAHRLSAVRNCHRIKSSNDIGQLL
jgi:hypothetical protein